MRKIHTGVYVGNQEDFEYKIKGLPDWCVVHACKEPYHRQALGYTGRAADKSHSEYLFAERDNSLILNLVVDNPDWISPIIIDKAINFIDESLAEKKNVLIHCNQGKSRSAGIGLLYLAHIGFYYNCTFEIAEVKYRQIYPEYNPAKGIRQYIENNWSYYCKRGE